MSPLDILAMSAERLQILRACQQSRERRHRAERAKAEKTTKR